MPNIKLKPLFITLFILVHGTIQAQIGEVPTINQKEDYTLTSKINKTKYQISVSLPMHYLKSDTTKYPVLYILDGNYFFPIAHSTRQMLDLAGALQDLIIVGIGYEWNKSYEPWFVNRWKDLTPSNNLKSDTSRNFRSILNLPNGSLHSGGASVFLEVIEKEIIPLIESKYKTNNERGIAGHSLGGLFVTYCLLSKPMLFNKYGINSPSLWWNNKGIFETERTFFQQHKELNAQVFISVGSEEGKSMVPPMSEFTDTLKAHNYSGLTVTSQIFDNETHFSVPGPAISRLLRVLYSRKETGH